MVINLAVAVTRRRTVLVSGGGYGRGRLGRVRGERFVSVERTPRANDERGVRDERDGR